MTTYRQQIVDFAQQQLGKPYVWGGIGPNGYDCSGLVYAAYKAAGLQPTKRPTANQIGHEGANVTVDQAQPGDIVYYDEPGPVDHVGIYVGGGKMIDAPTAGKPVELVGIGHPTAIRRNLFPGETDNASVAASVSSIGRDASGAVTSAVSDAFSGWQAGALAIGLKVAAVAACGALLVVGAKTAVNPGSPE